MLASLLASQPVIMIILEAVVVILAIFLGVRKSGIGLGMWGCAGVMLLVFLFDVNPGSPPIDAMLIVLCVISAAAAMQAAGGTDYLVMLASKIIKAHPKYITILAPIISFVFTFGAGTANIFMALLPVINEVAYSNNVRPERPISASATAAVMATICSPVSAAMAAMLTLVGAGSPYLGSFAPMTLTDILLIITPASLIAVLVLSFAQNFIGKPLDKDPEYQRRLAAGEIEPPKPLSNLSKDEETELRKGRLPALIFIFGVVLIIVFALFPSLRPMVAASASAGAAEAPLSMTTTIELLMTVVAVLIITVKKTKPSEVIKQSIWNAGIVSMIALFGVAWLADTFIQANIAAINTGLGDLINVFPLALAVALFIVGALTTSQSSATRSIVPIGLSLGMAPWLIVAMWPSVIGLHLFPANGDQIASVELDRTGSTKISKLIIWHSFTIPMLIGWVVSVAVGCLIAFVVFG